MPKYLPLLYTCKGFHRTFGACASLLEQKYLHIFSSIFFWGQMFLLKTSDCCHLRLKDLVVKEKNNVRDVSLG